MTVRYGKRIKISWLIIAILVVMVVFWIASGEIESQKQTLSEQESAAILTRSRLETERSALENEILASGTDAYIENLARTQYGFLKPGEIRFEITNPEALFLDNEQAPINIITTDD